MKKDLLKTGAILVTAVLICSSCSQRPKVQNNTVTNSKGQTAIVEVGVFDAVKLKDQIVETIGKAPREEKELADFINNNGFSYLLELTVPIENVEKYMTGVEQSLAHGAYTFDAAYAYVYDRQDVIDEIFGVQRKLIEKLDLTGEVGIMKKYDDRIKQNKENKDSLNAIVMDLMNEIGNSYRKGEHPGVYALTYVGSNIEAMYMLTQAALMAKDKAPLITFIGQQKERIKSIYSLLELTAIDESVNPIFEKMKPILEYFNKDQEFTATQLSEVAPLIEKLRKDIVK